MNPDEMAQHIGMFYGPPMTVIADCMRSFIIPTEGCDFTVADYSNIEGRGLAWLAGEDWKLGAFRAYDRGDGDDLYLIGATRILTLIGRPPATPLTKKSQERQGYGKVPELACGFQGSVGAFQSMARIYGTEVSDAEALVIVQAWRTAHPATKKYWRDLEDAAIQAVKNPGEVTQAGHPARAIKLRKAGSFLWARLPSGRCLCYPYPGIHLQWFAKKQVKALLGEAADVLGLEKHVPEIRKIKPSEAEAHEKDGWAIWSKDQLSFMSVDALTKQWGRQTTYGGSLCENMVQATCRDVMAEAMKRLTKAGYPIAFTVHDEIVTETHRGFGSLDEMTAIMCELPAWAADFPITAEGYRAARYRKG
jgi:DNA polymerase